MALSKEDLIARIRAAFANVALGNGVGLLEGQAIDDREPETVRAAERAKDEKTRLVSDLRRASQPLLQQPELFRWKGNALSCSRFHRG